MSYPYRPPHFVTVSHDKTLDFAGFMTSLYTYSEDSPEYLYNSFSAEYYRIFACSERSPRNPDVTMGRYETVHEDLYRFLAKVGVTEECLDDIQGFRRMNPSAHRHYSTYYTDSLVEQVYRYNRAIIDEFGYRFESASPDS